MHMQYIALTYYATQQVKPWHEVRPTQQQRKHAFTISWFLVVCDVQCAQCEKPGKNEQVPGSSSPVFCSNNSCSCIFIIKVNHENAYFNNTHTKIKSSDWAEAFWLVFVCTIHCENIKWKVEATEEKGNIQLFSIQ